MPTSDEYRQLAISARLGRLERTPDELENMISGRNPTELFIALDEPRLLVLGATPADLLPWRIGGPIGHPLDPARWAEERQYLRNDPHEAVAALRRRRTEVLTLLRSLSPFEWQRGGIHLSRGRLTLADWVASLAGHDDNHIDQLRRALDGRG
jgi:DinB superfamily